MSRELLILSSFTHQLNSKVMMSSVLKYIFILFSVFPLLSSVPIWDYFPLPLSIFPLVFFDDLLVMHVVFVWKCVYFYVASVFWAQCFYHCLLAVITVIYECCVDLTMVPLKACCCIMGAQVTFVPKLAFLSAVLLSCITRSYGT